MRVTALATVNWLRENTCACNCESNLGMNSGQIHNILTENFLIPDLTVWHQNTLSLKIQNPPNILQGLRPKHMDSLMFGLRSMGVFVGVECRCVYWVRGLDALLCSWLVLWSDAILSLLAVCNFVSHLCPAISFHTSLLFFPPGQTGRSVWCPSVCWAWFCPCIFAVALFGAHNRKRTCSHGGHVCCGVTRADFSSLAPPRLCADVPVFTLCHSVLMGAQCAGPWPQGRPVFLTRTA